MRKLLYAGLLLLGVTQVKAQENRGFLIPAKVIKHSVMVGGSVAGSYSRVSETRIDDKITGNKQNFSLDGKVGYFVWDDVALGIRASVNHERLQMEDQAGTNSTVALAGPFARYYLDNGIFGEGSAAIGKINKPGSTKKEAHEFRAGVGYAIFINPKVAVEPALLFSYYEEINQSEAKSKRTELGPLLNIGIQIYLFQERKFKL
ncbi:hypothetical protein [Rufibacter radiotolerans]|uniref:hypothetical protein n=1 Tax=Rufibacter radiotolerans TaxID=1379910 RepID=UPI000AF618FA|nr:hypothetical protein [Rufibacter radiotolerans]